MGKIAVDQTLVYCGLAIKSSALTFAIAERAFVSSFAKPLSVQGSEVVWLRDMLRMTASCLRSSVSMTDNSGLGIGVSR